MAPTLKVTAACLLALGAINGALGTDITAVPATTACNQAINLARRGKLNTVIGTVFPSAELEEKAVAAAKEKAGTSSSDNTTCNSAAVAPSTVGGFAVGLDQSKTMSPEECLDLIQKALTDGLKAVDTYPPPYDTSQSPWTNANAQNLAYLLWGESAQVGCGVSDNCTTNLNLLVCMFAPTVGQSEPFSKEYYEGLVARKDPLSSMKPSDLNPAVGSSEGGSSAAPSVAPTLFVVGALAITALASI